MGGGGGFVAMAVYQPDVGLLREQIASLRSQTVASWTCLIGVDGRDPATVSLLEKIVSGDPRFRVIDFEERVGFYRNFERILERAPIDASWIALADQDDRWHSTKFETLVPFLTEASLVSGQANVVTLGGVAEDRSGPRSTTARRDTSLEELIFDNTVSGALTLMRRDLLEAALPFPSPTDVAYHDHWLGLCALLQCGIKFVDSIVQDYVQHGENVIGESRTTVPARFASLVKKAEKGRVINYLIEQRWLWRVNMASTALVQCPPHHARDAEVLRAFSGRVPNLTLLRLALTALLRGRVSRLRVMGLAVASVLAPLNEKGGQGAE